MAPLNIEIRSGPPLLVIVATYTVSVPARLTARPTGVPAGIGCMNIVPQPTWVVALQVRSSNTDTLPVEPAPCLATYTVWVAGSTATAPGLVPTVTVGGAAPHPAGRRPLQVLVSIIETVFVFVALLAT